MRFFRDHWCRASKQISRFDMRMTRSVLKMHTDARLTLWVGGFREGLDNYHKRTNKYNPTDRATAMRRTQLPCLTQVTSTSSRPGVLAIPASPTSAPTSAGTAEAVVSFSPAADAPPRLTLHSWSRLAPSICFRGMVQRRLSVLTDCAASATVNCQRRVKLKSGQMTEGMYICRCCQVPLCPLSNFLSALLGAFYHLLYML
jgi:hypothetical protein